MSEKRGGSGCFRKSKPNPKEPPEGMIKLRLMVILWLCLRGKIEHKPKEVKDNMRTGTTIRAVATLLLVMLAMAAPIAQAIPWSDCHGIDPFADEAMLVADYTAAYYSASYFHNWCKANILDYSLPYADIWYFSGHGGQTLSGKNYLVAGDDGKIFPEDIPDLNNQHEFDTMRFAYASACYSGDSDWWQNDLPESFLDNGADAYMGWRSTVNGDTAYDFTDRFYYYAIDDGDRVKTAKENAENDVPAAAGNIKLFGSDVSLIP